MFLVGYMQCWGTLVLKIYGYYIMLMHISSVQHKLKVTQNVNSCAHMYLRPLAHNAEKQIWYYIEKYILVNYVRILKKSHDSIRVADACSWRWHTQVEPVMLTQML